MVQEDLGMTQFLAVRPEGVWMGLASKGFERFGQKNPNQNAESSVRETVHAGKFLQEWM